MIDEREDGYLEPYHDVSESTVVAAAAVNINTNGAHPATSPAIINEEVFPFEVLTQDPKWDEHIGQDDEGGDGEEGESAFYRITFPDNQGGAYYPGIPPFPGTPSEADRITEVRNEETGQWGPLPPGHCAPR